MSKNRLGPYSLAISLLLVVATITPAFAEVMTIETNLEQFLKGDKIKFSGTVEKYSKGIVTIVIRDGDDKFITLEQAVIDPDYSFERTVPIDIRFESDGIYHANGFILSLEKGATTMFEIHSKLSTPEPEIFETIISENDIEILPNTIENNPDLSFVDKSKDPQHYIDRYYNEISYKEWFDRNYPEITIEEAVGYEETMLSEPPIREIQPSLFVQNSPDFIDKSKDPQHYIDRYYNEISYKEWFDRNYPEITIEEAVGYDNKSHSTEVKIEQITSPEIIPVAEASSTVSSPSTPENFHIPEISLAVASLGILFGAVYGVKRKVDHNSKQISINRNILQKKFIRPLIGNDPETILKTRLAKGQISIKEYEQLKSKIN